MISQGSESLYAKILRLGYYMGFTAIIWKPKEKCLQYSTSSLRNFWLRFQFGLELAYQLFLVNKCLLAVMDPTMELRRKIRLQYVAAVYIVLNCNHMMGLFHGTDFVTLMNGFEGLVTQYFLNGKRNSITTDSKVFIALHRNISTGRAPKDKEIKNLCHPDNVFIHDGKSGSYSFSSS